MLFVAYTILGLIAGLLISAAFMPRSYTIEKTIVIQSPLPSVMSKVGDLHFYSQWNPWQQKDATAKGTITGTPMAPGHRYSWEGKKAGAGSLTLNSVDEKHLHFDLEFIRPFQSKAKDNWAFEAEADNATKVIWQNSGSFPWPMARLMGPMITRSLHQQFEQGLANLKKMCEGEGES